MSKVLNKHKDIIPKDAVYIGRGSKWGNPYSHLKNTKAHFLVETREEACEKYILWFCDQPELINSLDELRGKDLVCFCSPLKCHGDMLIELANLDQV